MNRTIFCDVDDTLVLWDVKQYQHLESVFVRDQIGGISTLKELKIHKKHIDLIKTFKQDNDKIVIWSAGGEQWANAVVDALGIREFVDVVLAKPDVYIDDLPANGFMPFKRTYLEP